MIFFAYASPTPGSAMRSASLAELRSTGSAFTGAFFAVSAGGVGGFFAVSACAAVNESARTIEARYLSMRGAWRGIRAAAAATFRRFAQDSDLTVSTTSATWPFTLTLGQ